MRQFGYDKDLVTLTSELSKSRALVTDGRFIGDAVNQILAGRDTFFWHRLPRVGVRLPRGVLFWYNCLGSMNVFLKGDTTREVPILDFIRWRDPFMHLRKGACGPTI